MFFGPLLALLSVQRPKLGVGAHCELAVGLGGELLCNNGAFRHGAFPGQVGLTAEGVDLTDVHERAPGVIPLIQKVG